MPGHKQKGKKNIRRTKVRFELLEPTGDQIIAVIEGTHGGYPPRFSCRTMTNELIVAPIQGSISKGPKRVLVKKDDLVLLEPLECNSGGETKYYIHHVYTKDDKRDLEKKGHLTIKTKTAEESMQTEVVFGLEQHVEAAFAPEAVDDEVDIDNI